MYGWWGFDSIRSWLSACQRRVVPLMVRFPRLAAVRPQCEVVCVLGKAACGVECVLASVLAAGLFCWQC